LFRAEDNMLHVAASRRLTRSDDTVLVRGNEGVIGQALKEAMPIFGTSGSKDPELQYFSAFHYCRSVLCVPLRANFDNYGVLVYGTEAHDAFDAEQTELLTSIGSQACVALQNAVLYRSLLDEKERLVEVEEDARKKLARDLHDGPTQSVAAIAMRMSYIYKLVEKNPAQVPEELKKVEDLARKTAKEIRHMLFTLRPLVLESQGLSAALVQLGEKMQETHGQAVQVRMGRDVDGHLSGHQQGVLFYVIEEAVNNARKHAQAPIISVQLGRQERTIICQIADNGVGFDTSIVTTNYEKRGSLGMVNMRERVELLGGSLRMESVPGKGTSITIYIPIADTQNGRDGGGDGASKRPQTKLAVSAMSRFENSVR
jgi:signal transduction histidine kinase